jgi:hypothetical protein
MRDLPRFVGSGPGDRWVLVWLIDMWIESLPLLELVMTAQLRACSCFLEADVVVVVVTGYDCDGFINLSIVPQDNTTAMTL